MRKGLTTATVFLCMVLLSLGAGVTGQADDPATLRNPDFDWLQADGLWAVEPTVEILRAVDSRVLIGYHDTLPDETPDYVTEHGEIVVKNKWIQFIAVQSTPGQVPALMAAAREDPRVAYVERDVLGSSESTPNDVLYSSQWGHQAVRLPQAWKVQQGSHDVSLHVLDSGVDYSHADLVLNLSPVCDGATATGRGFTGVETPEGYESGFHGTHVAGIAAAVTGNTIGIAGASQSCITSVRMLATVTILSAAWAANAITWSAVNGADIINMSWWINANTPVANALSFAHQQNVLLVKSAGNTNCGSVSFPGTVPEVMAVASLQSPTQRSSFSACGPEVEIAAPGSNIWSTIPGNTYGSFSGTSMAAPLVAGIAGLVLAENPALSNEQIRCILVETADSSILTSNTSDQVGAGRVDAYDAVLAAPVPWTVGC